MDRIERNDRRQDRLIGLDKIAGTDRAVADTPGDRRPDLGIFEIQFGALDRSAGAFDRGLGGKELLPPFIECRHRNVAAADQFLGTLELALGEGRLGLGDLQLRTSLGERGLEGALIDGEEERTGLDDAALFEVNVLEIATDAGTDFDEIDRFEPADELIVLDNLADNGFGSGHPRRTLLCGEFGRHHDGHDCNRACEPNNAPHHSIDAGEGGHLVGVASCVVIAHTALPPAEFPLYGQPENNGGSK